MEATIVYADGSATDAQYMAIVAAVAESLARANLNHCRAGGLPSLYRSGVRYRDLAGQTWRDARTILAQLPTVAQCVELSAWRVAELRCQGRRAKVGLVATTEPGIFHAVVADQRGNIIEDPSARLGMVV